MMLFIDGIDGSGKSTLTSNLFDRILEENREYHDQFQQVVNSFQFPTRLPEGADKANPLARTMFYLRDFQETMLEHRERDDYRLFDRSFVSTLAYQGFDDGLESNSMYEGILRLGAEAFFSQEVPGVMGTYYPEHCKKIFFIHVKCDPDVASERIDGRETDREGDIEKAGRYSRIKQLRTLSERFDIVYMDLKRRLSHFVKNRDFHWRTVDTTESSQDHVIEEVLDVLSPVLWPRQQEIPFS